MLVLSLGATLSHPYLLPLHPRSPQSSGGHFIFICKPRSPYADNSIIARDDYRCDTLLTELSVLVRVSIPAQNIMTKNPVGEERVYSVYTSKLLFITNGSQE